MKYIKATFAVSLLACSTAAWPHAGATEVVKERMDQFKESKASVKVLKKALKAQDFVVITKEATAINLWAKQLTKAFPAASNPHPSEALDSIWQEFDQFEHKAKAQIDASENLKQAGMSQDIEEATAAFKQLTKSCKSCHENYRE